ncbi:MAG: deoxyhypusine synthase [Thermoprotei archaeon]|nr:MAG: deoxyhypusine synthase [Thermoprotei archaeon]
MSVKREDLLRVKVVDLDLKDVADEAGRYVDVLRRAGGFSGRYIVHAVDVLLKMFSEDAVVILSFPANIVATGLRGLLSSMVRSSMVDAVITTGGTFDHDIARGVGGDYYVGDFELDDVMLKELEIHRLGNILIPFENYGPLVERFVHEMLEDISREKTAWKPSELAEACGTRLEDRYSILRSSYERKVKVFSPGIVDSAFGTAIYTFNEIQRSRTNPTNIVVDVAGDMSVISDLVLSADKLGGIMLGGGISKHHLIWWSQFRGGLDFAVSFTSAPEWDGSLSGARVREAISWGKVKTTAAHVTVPGDLTVIFPFVIGYVARELGFV